MIFYSTDEILKKFQKFYDNGTIFRAFIEEKEIFPCVVKLKSLKQKDLIENFSTVLKELERLKKIKLEINYKEFQFKSIGSQKLPISVTCRTIEEFLEFVGKADEYRNYKAGYYKATKEFPVLKELFVDKPKLLLETLPKLDKILKIISFYRANPHPNIYIRELPMVGIDTKFVEQNKKEIDLFLMSILNESNIVKLSNNGFEKKYGFKYKLPLVRFRILDSDLYLNGLSDVCTNIDEFRNLSLTCKRIFLVENEITALSFPNMKNAIVIFAKGYGVGLFKDVKWMRNKEIHYWGDIDMDGFAILSQARGYFPQIKSLFMDIETLEEFIDLGVKSNDKSYKKLINLTKNEALLYDRLFSDYYGENFRLEQEKLPVLSRILVK